MKKTLFVISSLFFIGCANSNDIIYSQGEEQNLNSKEALTSISNRMSSLNKSSEATLMDLDLNKPLIQNSGGGCSFSAGYSVGNMYTSTAAFGPTPISFFGYTVRGYGKPRTDGFLWKGIKLDAENKPKTITSRGQSFTVNDPISSALSIEFPFEANATYEIILTTYVNDQIFYIKHDPSYNNTPMRDWYNIDKSQAFPTVAIGLMASPEISGTDPCASRPVVGNGLASANYYKRQKAEISYDPYKQPKTFIFNFSTIESKNAFLIYFLPELSEQIPQSIFQLYLAGIKIIKKPFDPAHYIKGSGFRD